MLVLCDVHTYSHPLNEQHEQITLLEGGKLYLLNEEDLETIVLPWKCHDGHVHIMELCDDRNNCAKFQFYAEKVFRGIPFFVILHFMSTM